MKRLVFVFTVAMVLAAAGMAHAELEPVSNFFDESKGWWMAESAWEEQSEATIDMQEVGDNLTAVTTTGGDGGYGSKWNLLFDSDFTFSVNYHYDPADHSDGGIGMGGESPNSMDDNGIAVFAGYIDGAAKYKLQWMLSPENYGEMYFDRALTDGTFSAAYIFEDKTMVVSASGVGVLKEFDLGPMSADSALAVGLGAGGDAALFGSEAYLTNFQVSGHIVPGVAPEPVSSALFLLGGAVLAVRRFKKGKKA